MKIKVTYIPHAEEIAVVRVIDDWVSVTGDIIVEFVRKVDNEQYPEAYDCD